MSQSSVSDQVKELEAAGMPVRRGTRMTARDPEEKVTPSTFGSDLWLSRWSQNAFRNYPVVSRAKGVRFLCDAAKGLPAFVVGVGPSLDEAIQELRNLRTRAIIIAVDASVRALMANGIRPNLVVSYDCKDEQRLLWETLPDAPPCLFNSCAHPDSIASWPGPVMFFNQFHSQDDLCGKILPVVFPEIGQLPSGGTVGTMAIFAAHLMGCDPICLVGMDFCFQPSKADPAAYRYRATDYRLKAADAAAGTPATWEATEIKDLYDNDERLGRSFLVTNDNVEYRTDPELSFYFDSFKNLMPHFKIPVVNCTPSGMIPKFKTDLQGTQLPGGFPSMTVADAVSQHCKAEFQDGRSILYHLGKVIQDPRTP